MWQDLGIVTHPKAFEKLQQFTSSKPLRSESSQAAPSALKFLGLGIEGLAVLVQEITDKFHTTDPLKSTLKITKLR